MLAEDEPGVRKTLEHTLRDAGYHVVVTSDGDEALREGLLRIREIDLVLTDVVMPTLSGPLVAERLLAERPDLPVILMSGYSDRLFASDGKWDPRTSFLEKPFTPTQLIELIERSLGRTPIARQ